MVRACHVRSTVSTNVDAMTTGVMLYTVFQSVTISCLTEAGTILFFPKLKQSPLHSLIYESDYFR